MKLTLREYRARSQRTQKLSDSMRRRAHRAERRAGIIVTQCLAHVDASKDNKREN